MDNSNYNNDNHDNDNHDNDNETLKKDEVEVEEKDNVVGGEGEGEVVGGGGEGKGEVVGIRKRFRNFLVDKSVDMVKRSGIPLDLACLMLKIFHFRLPFDLICYAGFGNVFAGLCLWVFVMGVFSFFLLLDGCVLSVIEYKLTGNSLNVMDVFLWLGGYELNYTNRYYATIVAAVIYLLAFFGIVFYRGGFRVEHLNRLMYYLSFTYLPNFFSSGLAADAHASFYN